MWTRSYRYSMSNHMFFSFRFTQVWCCVYLTPVFVKDMFAFPWQEEIRSYSYSSLSLPYLTVQSYITLSDCPIICSESPHGTSQIHQVMTATQLLTSCLHETIALWITIMYNLSGVMVLSIVMYYHVAHSWHCINNWYDVLLENDLSSTAILDKITSIL